VEQGPFPEEDTRDAQLEAIFRAQAADLYRYIARQVREAALAEDLTSAVFLRALRWLEQDRSQESVKGWLSATARSLIADYWREYAQLPQVSLEAAVDMLRPPDANEAQMHSLQARIQRLFILGRVAQAKPGAAPQTSPDTPVEEPLFTLRTRMVLVMAGKEAQRRGEPAISPQHLLVAILREGQGGAAMLLQV
jgi:hypothetical protein